MDAIGNIQSMDMPVIIVALRQLTRAMEKIDPKLKFMADLMETKMKTEIIVTTTTVKRG